MKKVAKAHILSNIIEKLIYKRIKLSGSKRGRGDFLGSKGAAIDTMLDSAAGAGGAANTGGRLSPTTTANASTLWIAASMFATNSANTVFTTF
jgi:hypothetical protein